MPAPSNPTARMWRETCPDQLLPLVDALMIYSRKVKHPLILRATQHLNKCYPVCNYSGNLRDTASHLVSLVARNRHYLSIIKWVCPVCKTDNKATTTCSFCPRDPFKNSPLLTLLGKSFETFFKDLVQLIASNPPTNYAPESITNYRLI